MLLPNQPHSCRRHFCWTLCMYQVDTVFWTSFSPNGALLIVRDSQAVTMLCVWWFPQRSPSTPGRRFLSHCNCAGDSITTLLPPCPWMSLDVWTGSGGFGIKGLLVYSGHIVRKLVFLTNTWGHVKAHLGPGLLVVLGALMPSGAFFSLTTAPQGQTASKRTRQRGGEGRSSGPRCCTQEPEAEAPAYGYTAGRGSRRPPAQPSSHPGTHPPHCPVLLGNLQGPAGHVGGPGTFLQWRATSWCSSLHKHCLRDT